MRAFLIIGFLLFTSAALAQDAAPPSPDGLGASAAPKTTLTDVPPDDRLKTLDRRITVLENKSPPAWYMPVLTTVFGIVLGTIFSIGFTMRAESRDAKIRRTNSAIDVAAEWIKMFPKMSHVNYCLENPNELREKENRLAVAECGNWMEITAQRVTHSLVDRDLLAKIGIIELMRTFWRKYEAAAVFLEKAEPALDIRKTANAWSALAEQATKKNTE